MTCINPTMVEFGRSAITLTVLNYLFRGVYHNVDTMPAGAIPFPFGDCRICSDKATGVHYGVATCEGCKVSGEVLFTCLASVRVFAKLEFFKNPNKSLKWVGGSRSHSDKKKIEIQFFVRTIRPCLAVHVAPRGVHACSILSRIL